MFPHFPRQTELAKEAKLALGTALRVCETLEKLLLMEREGRGPQSLRRLPEPSKLLDAWAEKYRLDAYRVHRGIWTNLQERLAAPLKCRGVPTPSRSGRARCTAPRFSLRWNRLRSGFQRVRT